jgi:hypothetical protein
VQVAHIDEPEIEDDLCDSMDELGIELEFYDEFSRQRIQMTAADGSSLRVLAYALDVILCRRVEGRVERSDLALSACSGRDARSGIAEVCRGEVHRILWADGRVEPSDPFGSPHAVQILTGGDLGSLRSFSRRWAEAFIEQAKQGGA